MIKNQFTSMAKLSKTNKVSKSVRATKPAKAAEGYELMIIIKPLLPEDLRAAVQKKLIALIQAKDGELTQTDVWGKRHLAYKIAGHDEGYYVVYQCKLAAARISEISNELKLNADILRYLLVKAE